LGVKTANLVPNGILQLPHENKMPYKPLPLRVYARHLKVVNWTLEKGGVDYNLFNENGAVCLCYKNIAWIK
jgi:hypothetical protein